MPATGAATDAKPAEEGETGGDARGAIAIDRSNRVVFSRIVNVDGLPTHQTFETRGCNSRERQPMWRLRQLNVP